MRLITFLYQLIKESKSLFKNSSLNKDDLKQYNIFNYSIRSKHMKVTNLLFHIFATLLVFAFTRSFSFTLPLIIFFFATIYLLKAEKFYLYYYVSFFCHLSLPLYRFYQYGTEMSLATSGYLIMMVAVYSKFGLKLRDYIISTFVFFILFLVNNFYFMDLLLDDLDELKNAINKFKYLSVTYFVFSFFSLLVYSSQHDDIIFEMWKIQKKMSSDKQANLLLTLSHEVQNPLNILMNELEFSKEKLKNLSKLIIDIPSLSPTLDKLQKSMFHGIEQIKIQTNVCKQSTYMLGRIISNMLDKSKIDVNELEYTPSFKSLNKILIQYWDFISYKLNKNELNGSLLIDTRIPDNLKLDSHFILSILFNLKTNAIKYSEGEEVQTIISWVKDEENIGDIKPTKYFMDKYKSKKMMRSANKKSTFKDLITNSEVWTSEGYIPSEKGAYCLDPYNPKKSVLNNNLTAIDTRNKNINSFTKIEKFEFMQELPDYLYKPSISTASFSEKGFLKIEVFDSGPGIPNVESIFDRTDQYSKQRLGLGLGLWLTKKMCDIMNAQIKVFTESKRGSQFVVLIPVEAAIEKPIISNKEVKNIDEVRALVVDDDLFNREICKKHLKDIGVKHLYEAQNGKEAYKHYLTDSDINIIFMDLEMPIMGGKQASELIRDYENKSSKIPVKLVIASGNCSKSERDDCMNPEGPIKANLFIRKPLMRTDFLEAINLVMKI